MATPLSHPSKPHPVTKRATRLRVLARLGRPGATSRTQRERFEHERKALADRFTKAFSTSPDCMAINRLEDGVYLDINEGFTRTTGYTREELMGRSSREEDLCLWVHNADRERLVQGILATGEVVDLEAEFRMKDGTIIVGLMSCKRLEFEDVACIISSTRNITPLRRAEEERRELQAQLHQAQKLESLGALAGGVAHDMNNVLGAILSLASARSAQLGPDHAMTQAFETIVKACLRGRGVVRSLLYFARRDLQEICPVDLNTLVQEVVQLLAHTTLQRMNLETRLEPSLWPIQGDAGALSHALMNLCVNAMDAMPRGGDLRLETRNLPDGRVQVGVTDTGEGMSEEVQFRAVEPFFTTKPVGKGTGLGLAMVFGTMEAHGGGLAIQSRPGAGTSVTLTFPADRPAAEPEPAAAPGVPHLAGKPLAILLVDDDEFILESVEFMLGLCGHQVQTAQDGPSALAILDGFPARRAVDLIVLDLNMPGMTGAETLARILALRAGQAVLLASGYHDGAIADLLADRPSVGFIQKPFSMDEFQAKLQDMGVTGP